MARFIKDTASPRVRPAGTKLHGPKESGPKPGADNEETELLEDENDEIVPVPLHLKNRREMNTTERAGILVCTFLLAGMILFVLTGYERITRAYSAINTLNKDIDDAKLRISELNVAIECAVTIDQAENAALAAGMTYPKESQIFNDYRFPNGTAAAAAPSEPGGTPESGAVSGEDPTENEAKGGDGQ